MCLVLNNAVHATDRNRIVGLHSLFIQQLWVGLLYLQWLGEDFSR